MAKNLMVELAKLLGVELGEKFIIQNADRKENVVISLDGFHVIQPNNVLGPDHGKLLSKVLQGLYEVKKKPWEPRKSEKYWCLCIDRWKCYYSVHPYTWNGDIDDFLRLRAGIIYRKKEEAEANLAEDYERLTGKRLV